MNKMMVCAAIAAFASAAIADEAKATNAVSKARKWSVEKSRMVSFGGYVLKEGSAHGKVVFLNAQQKVKSADLGKAMKVIEDVVHPLYELKDVETVKVSNPAADIANAGGTIGVVIADVAAAPALLVAPENGWAVVNVSALEKDCPNADTLIARTRKEVLRAFAMVGGGAFVARDPEVMRMDVRVPKDLDLIAYETYGVDVKSGFENNLPLTGITPWRKVTYKKACQEGWAHSPTNEYQKRIWDKVHQLPTNPLPLVKPTK